MTLTSFSFKGSRTAVLLWLIALTMLIFDAGFYRVSYKQKGVRLAGLEGEYLKWREASRSTGINKPDSDEELIQVYDRLPEWGRFTKVMGEIYSKAEGLNLSIDSVSYRSEAVKGSVLTKVTISMPVVGSYGNIKRFVYELESSPRLFIVENLSLGAGRTDGKDISLSLTIVAHFKG